MNLLNDKKSVAEGQTPLIIAVNTSRTWDEDKTTPDEADERALLLVEACIQYGANFNQTDTSGRTALHWAVMAGTASIVKRFLDAGGDAEIKDAKKRGILDWWTHQRNKATLEVLKQRVGPKALATKQAMKSNDEQDSEVDSEDEVDQRKELKKYFPAVPTTTAGASSSLHHLEPAITMSEERERLVKRLMWFGSRSGWSREVCVDALVKRNWDFNAATGYVCQCITNAENQRRLDSFDG